MPRSRCENENIQFVQELAEVDGPFESPININFRDLIKLELPSLAWNRSDACPRKMKMTNTGHTVIISGKWKCERPYLTGGPLLGKYVFSQIHFHWGQDDSRGSEHMVCGEGFPLEMHVVHFKTEYLTQEYALREKDGMVVVVYLFKLQEEPNAGLKKILNSLSNVKQAGTSFALDPRPILTLCNPFTDDYFMYWGSVVTTTCAHIFMWIVCREPFGISREQVNEFRKILDPSQQPIGRNSREPQPLHRRNVFHINASKSTDFPMLPVKKMMGCYCRKSEEDFSAKPTANKCCCQAYAQTQEDVEEGSAQSKAEFLFNTVGSRSMGCKASPPKGINAYQSYFVQSAIIHSAPLIPKSFNTKCEPDLYELERKHPNPEGGSKHKLVSQSCCFLPMTEVQNITTPTEKRKPRRRRGLCTIKALSQLMDSLEALKNHTFKKLREIESINQEIKGMKLFCQEAEDKQWLRKIEQIMSRQKRFTIKSSRSCFGELKRLARECNIDKIFDHKDFSEALGSRKLAWFWESDVLNQGTANKVEEKVKDEEESKPLKPIEFTEKAQELIHRFFEVIKDGEEVEESVRNDLKSICSKQAGDSAISVNKGQITQKMFILGNFGDQFFTDVTTEDGKVKRDEDTMNTTENKKPLLKESEISQKSLGEEVFPLRRANINIKSTPRHFDAWLKNTNACQNEFQVPHLNLESDSSSTSESDEIFTLNSVVNPKQKIKSYKSSGKTNKKLEKYLDPENIFSSSEVLTDSTETQRMIITKLHKKQTKKNKSLEFVHRGICERASYKKVKNLNVEGFYYKKRNSRNKKKHTQKTSDSSSTSKEEKTFTKWKRMTKAKFRLEIKKTSESTIESAIEYSLISPKRKKLKLQYEKVRRIPERQICYIRSNESLTEIESDVFEKSEISPKSKRFQKVKDVIQDLVAESLKKQQMARIHIPKVSQSKLATEGLTNKTFRASSNESKPNETEKPVVEDKTLEIAKLTRRRNFEMKNRSLTDLKTKTTRHSSEISQRVFVESLEERQRSARDASELKKIFESPRVREMFVEGANIEKPKVEPIKDTQRKLESLETESEQTYRVGFLTEVACQLDEELNKKLQPPENAQNKETEAVVEEPKETPPQDRPLQVKIVEGTSKKEDCAETPKVLTSDTYLTAKKNSQSRPHSAETLHSLTKIAKKKRKKRPHCCKRSSRHYIRRNSTVFKKHPKVESKPVCFIGLPEEEQLKIISVNVAKYLKQKLVEQKAEEGAKKEVVENQKEETQVKETDIPKPSKTKQEPEKIVKKTTPKTETKKGSVSEEQEKKVASSPRPVHNFIKLNKEMAGKYKRAATPVVKKGTNLKNREEGKKGSAKLKEKNFEKRRIPVRIEVPHPAKTHIEERAKTPKKSEGPKNTSKPADSTPNPNPETKTEVLKKPSTSTLAVQKLPTPKKRWVPAYTLTSYLPNPVNIVESQQRKMSGYFLNMKTASVASYLPEMLCDTNLAKAGSRSDSLLTKDLEYLIKLQMCLNNEISENIENSMNYVKTILSQDLNGSAIIEKAPVSGALEEPFDKGVMLIEMNNVNSSSSSDRIDEYQKDYKKCSLSLRESGDCEANKPLITELDAPEDHSDSSYNCEISITLNAGSQGEIQCYDPDLERDSNISQATTLLDLKSSSQSIILKPHRKKRKDCEISTEMKNKLLEILDKEIKRELGATYGISSEASSDGLTFRWDDSDGMNRSQSTDSSFDNTEVLAQISEAMKEYLTDYIEKKRLVDETLEKEGKGEDPP